MQKRNVTDEVIRSADVEGHLKGYEWMMQSNRGSIIEEGSYGQETAKAAKASKERNRNAKKADRRD